MSGSSQAKRSVVFRLVLGGLLFILLLLFVITAYRQFPISPVLIVALVVLTVGVVIGVSVTILNRRRRTAIAQIRQQEPDGPLFITEWNALMLPAFVSDPELVAGADERGFGVDLVGNANGITLWRVTHHGAVLLGRIPWSGVQSLTPGEVKAPVGPKHVPTLTIAFDASDGLTSPVQLVVRRDPVATVIRELTRDRPESISGDR